MGLPLPITRKLWPSNAANWLYIAEVAVLTRIATGVMRILENRPSKQKDPRLSQNEKRQALMERVFVEIFGTAGYMTFLHLGQDAVNMLYHPPIPKIQLSSMNLSQEAHNALKELGLCVKTFDQKINAYMKDVYAPVDKNGKGYTKDLIYRVLYGDPVTGHANLEALKNKFAEASEVKAKNLSQAALDKAFNQIVNEVKPLKKFAMRNNLWASAAILTGVSLSAVVGGTVVQKLCDGPVAATSKKWLNNHYQGDSHPEELHNAMAHAGNATAPKSLSVVSEAPPLLPPVQAIQPPPMAPLYLPNPKQPTATPFAANTMAFPYQAAVLPRVGGPTL